jgi:Abnormal spindle-like microcephaly-assoc'd, ASPM-SPD-2-Hydin
MRKIWAAALLPVILVLLPAAAGAAEGPPPGSEPAPQLSFSPASLDFGIVRVNQSASQNLQVTNGGEAGTQIGWVGVEGKDSGNFWTGSSDCWNGRWLAPEESCWIQVNFNGWQAVGYEAALTVYADNVPFSAELHGAGGEAMLMPEINPVEFGSAAVGGEGTVRTIHLSNEGNIGGGYFIAVIAGGDVGSFELIDESCTGDEIAPGGTCVAHIRFDPVGLGRKVARLAMFGDSNGGTMVFLRGEGEPAAAEGTSAIPPAPKQAKSARKKRAFAHGYALELGRRCKRAKLCNHPKVFEAGRAAAG